MEGGLNPDLMQVLSNVDQSIFEQIVTILKECLFNSNKLLEIE